MPTVTLERDCRAVRIPSGDPVELQAGRQVEVTQALGGSVTVRAGGDLLRIAGEDLEALGTGFPPPHELTSVADGPFDEAHLWAALKQCFDPEIPVNIVDLGLVYDLKTEPAPQDQVDVFVKMTLTAPGCGMGPTIAQDAKGKLEALPQVRSAKVELVWDPQWTPHMISPAGREKLGLDD